MYFKLIPVHSGEPLGCTHKLFPWPWEGGKAAVRPCWWKKAPLALRSGTLVWLNLEAQPLNGQDKSTPNGSSSAFRTNVWSLGPGAPKPSLDGQEGTRNVLEDVPTDRLKLCFFSPAIYKISSAELEGSFCSLWQRNGGVDGL